MKENVILESPDTCAREPRITYLLYDGTAIKIGSTSDLDGVSKRLQACQTGNPRKIIVVGVTNVDEPILHKRFAESRLSGEWFSLSHDIIEFIASTEVLRIRKFRNKWFREWV